MPACDFLCVCLYGCVVVVAGVGIVCLRRRASYQYVRATAVRRFVIPRVSQSLREEETNAPPPPPPPLRCCCLRLMSRYAALINATGLTICHGWFCFFLGATSTFQLGRLLLRSPPPRTTRTSPSWTRTAGPCTPHRAPCASNNPLVVAVCSGWLGVCHAFSPRHSGGGAAAPAIAAVTAAAAVFAAAATTIWTCGGCCFGDCELLLLLVLPIAGCVADDGGRYDLYAVCNHYGAGLHYGHYTATVRAAA
jgi:hypothetical protein